MTDKPLKESRGNLIKEPLSSYDPPPFDVEGPTIQNRAPEYHGHGRNYVPQKGADGEDSDQNKDS